MGLIVSELYCYPLKSTAGISLNQAELDSFGICQDRRWMLVDHEGLFVSQRKHPALALVHTELTDSGIRFTSTDHPNQQLTVNTPSQSVVTEVQVWSDLCSAIDAGEEAAQWFSRYLSKQVRLVYMPSSTLRQVDLTYAQNGDRVSFADGFPLLLANQGSLDDLNSRLVDPVGINRFRPNIVVSGCDGFAEDTWRRIRVGEVEFSVCKPCERCIMTTVDPQTGERGKEPLATLAKYRSFNNKVMFGQNLLHHSEGSIKVGDQVEILE